MDSIEEAGYEPSTEFQEVNTDPLIDISLSDNTELWLIHCPKIKNFSLSDLDGQEVSLQLHHDNNIGSFVGSSGKSYDMVKNPTLNNNLAVFLSSAEGSKIVGKISRGISLVHYPDPSEQGQNDKRKVEQMAQRAVEARFLSTPSRTFSRSVGHTMHKSSRTKSSGSGLASGSGVRLSSGSKTPMKRPNTVGDHKRDHSGSGSGSGLASGSSLHLGSGSKTPMKRPNTDSGSGSGSGLASGSSLRLGSGSETPMKRPNTGGDHKRDHSGSGSGKQRSS